VKRLVPIAPGVLGAETSFRVAAGIRLPLRMTVLCTAGGIALVAPIPIDDALAAELAGVGPVQLLIAPNLLHHASLEAASERYPGARVLAAPGLAGKRPELRIDATLTSSDVTPEIQALHLQGVDALSEVVLPHRPSRTLVVTDLVFNVHEATGLSRLVLSLASRAFGRVEQSRLLRRLTTDRTLAAQSIEELLALPFDRVVVAHGQVIEGDARAQLSTGLWWMRGRTRRPPAAE
jgi:hypothetical protein